MSGNNKRENFKDTIVIDSSLIDDSSDVVTINASDLNNAGSDDKSDYKISKDGKVTISNVLSNLKENHSKDKSWREILTSELIKYGFEKIPAELKETQLENILEFAIYKVSKGIEFGQIHPFSVEKTDNGGLTVILLMFNGNEHPFSLESLPLKLKDANNKVIFTDFANLSKTTSPQKIGIYYIKINKDILQENNMDLTTWNITFER